MRRGRGERVLCVNYRTAHMSCKLLHILLLHQSWIIFQPACAIFIGMSHAEDQRQMQDGTGPSCQPSRHHWGLFLLLSKPTLSIRPPHIYMPTLGIV